MTVNSSKEIAEELNNHLTSIAKNIEKKVIKPNCDFSKFLRMPTKILPSLLPQVKRK